MKYLPWLLLSFEGRISRQTYWFFSIVMSVIIFVPAVAIFGLGTEEGSTYVLLISVVTFWPVLAVQAKRWHDINKSALWLLINFLPYIGWMCGIIANGFIAGTEGSNDYGEGPILIFEEERNET